MRRHLDMKQPSAGVLNDDKHTEDAKSRGDCHAKVTSHDTLGVIANKGGAALRLAAFAWGTDAVVGHVFTYGSWRDFQTELEKEFVGDAFLSPRQILHGHASNESLQVLWQSRSTGFRVAAP